LPDKQPTAVAEQVPTVPGPAARNIEAIAALERAAREDRSRLDRFTDMVTSAAGSPIFIVAHGVWFAGWIVLNVTRDRPFDAYPFGLLMLVVSLEAIFLSAAVLMTQNRMQRQADKRAHLDLQVNMLAEQELTAILRMLSNLSERLGLDPKQAGEPVEGLLEPTDINTLAAALDRELPDAATSPAPSSAPVPRTPSPHRS
jgi:uncharacterized membrane protein